VKLSRWHPPALFAVLVAIGCLGAACGSDDPPAENIPASNTLGVWSKTVDPYTNKEVHCYTIYQSTNYENGGPATWCYQP
jgi:hypothetical protein